MRPRGGPWTYGGDAMGLSFLLVGHSGFHNRGCEAIVRTTVGLLRARFPGSRIVLSSFSPDQDRASKLSAELGIEVVPANVRFYSAAHVVARVARSLSWPSWRFLYLYPLWEPLRKADAVLAVGGDNLTQDYGYPTYHVWLNNLALRAGKPLVVWAATVGPFTDDCLREEVCSALRRAALVTVRESLTQDYLASLQIVENVRLVADPAFLLSPTPCPLTPFWPKDRPVLGINVSPLIARYCKRGAEWFVGAITRLCREASERHGLAVLFIPHVTPPTGSCRPEKDDHLFMSGILRGLPTTIRACIVPPRLDSAQTKFVISHCAIFVGARTHSTIAAMSSAVPTLSLGYSRKAQGINQDVFGHQRWVLDVRHWSHEDELLERFRSLVAERDVIATHLRRVLPVFEARARAGVDYLAEALG